LNVTVRYYACDDAQTFCVPVTQRYQVRLASDPDGGSRRAPPAPEASRARAGTAFRDSREMVIRFFDADGNRSISSDEIEAAPDRLRRLDRNGDGNVDRSELPGADRGRPE
jgi:hypothetical protein